MGARDLVRAEVLGPIRVADAEGRDLTPDGVLQRRLLALLVLHRGRVVPAGAAVDVLWPTKLPRDPAAALQTHVFRLRRGLPSGLVESVGDGYRVEPTAVEVDADRLAAIVASDADDDDDDDGGLPVVEAVLREWHGPAYPELDDVDDGRAEAQRLEELRVRAREVRARWRLARGDTDGLVAELTALADAEPLRERPRQLLMEVLAATGRHVEALRVYDDFRRLLGDELGIEPSPVLAAQHDAMLAGRPLDAAEPEVADGTPTAWAPASRLPAPTTSLVGRDQMVAELVALVDLHRLVCLVGPGGVGKTQLAVEVGRRLGRAWPEQPVVLCELATADTGSALDVVAAALGIDVRPGTPLAARVAAVVGDGDVTVIIDNCEHVLEPVAELVDRMLRSCPNVKVVATSRERLRVPGEQVIVVPPLSVDGGDSPAAALFVERAGAVRPGLAQRRRAGHDRRDRHTARRLAAGDRAGCRVPAHPRPRRGGGWARPPVLPPVVGFTRVAPPLLAQRGRVVVLRAAGRVAATGVPSAVRVRGTVQRCRCRGGVRGRRRLDHRGVGGADRAISRAANRRPPVRRAGDVAGLRRRPARRGRSRGAR